jgi:hypothetical protein
MMEEEEWDRLLKVVLHLPYFKGVEVQKGGIVIITIKKRP